MLISGCLPKDPHIIANVTPIIAAIRKVILININNILLFKVVTAFFNRISPFILINNAA